MCISISKYKLVTCPPKFLNCFFPFVLPRKTGFFLKMKILVRFVQFWKCKHPAKSTWAENSFPFLCENFLFSTKGAQIRIIVMICIWKHGAEKRSILFFSRQWVVIARFARICDHLCTVKNQLSHLVFQLYQTPRISTMFVLLSVLKKFVVNQFDTN